MSTVLTRLTTSRPIAWRLMLIIGLALAAVLIGVVGATDAAAAVPTETNPDPAYAPLGDSRGVPLSRFTIDVNDGNRWNPSDLGLWVFSLLMQLVWEFYKGLVSGVVWILDFALQMEWVNWLLTPLNAVGDGVQEVIAKFGIGPLMLTILAFIVAIYIFRGRTGTGVAELLIGLVIAALSLGVLSDPVDTVAGPNGVIVGSRDAGIDLATAMATNGRQTQGNTDTYINGVTGSLVDTMVRLPHQIANYGMVIDGTACESVYNEWVGKDGAREHIAECGADLKTYSDTPTAANVMMIVEMFPPGLSFLVFGLALAILLVLSVVLAGWHAVKAVFILPFAVVPGGPRSALWSALGGVALAAVMIIVTSVFVYGWMQLVGVFFTGLPAPSVTSGQGLIAAATWRMRMQVFSSVLLAGVVVLVMARSKIKKQLEAAAARLSRLGSRGSQASAPVKLPKIPQVMPRLLNRNPAPTGARPGANTPPSPGPTTPVTPTPTPATPPAPGSTPGVPPAGTLPRGGGSTTAPAATEAPGGLVPAVKEVASKVGASAGAGSADVARGAAAAGLRSRLAKGAGGLVRLGAAAASGGSSAAVAGGVRLATAAARAGKAVAAARTVAQGGGAARSAQNVALRGLFASAQGRHHAQPAPSKPVSSLRRPQPVPHHSAVSSAASLAARLVTTGARTAAGPDRGDEQ